MCSGSHENLWNFSWFSLNFMYKILKKSRIYIHQKNTKLYGNHSGDILIVSKLPLQRFFGNSCGWSKTEILLWINPFQAPNERYSYFVRVGGRPPFLSALTVLNGLFCSAILEKPFLGIDRSTPAGHNTSCLNLIHNKFVWVSRNESMALTTSLWKSYSQLAGYCWYSLPSLSYRVS